MLLLLFRGLGLGEHAALAAMPRPTTNPLRYVPRFLSQPRLLLAWTNAVTRLSWWGVYFVYAPILTVTSDFSAEAGGIVASIGTGWTWLVPIWSWADRRFGLRWQLQIGYTSAGVLSIVAALAFTAPWLGALLLALEMFGAETIDGAGNLLFLRAASSVRAPGNDGRVCQLPQSNAVWPTRGVFGAAGVFQPAVCFRSRQRDFSRFRSTLRPHPRRL
jgi:ACDE family multidrug resistance protein